MALQSLPLVLRSLLFPLPRQVVFIWNNNGGGDVVINRGTTYGPRGYYNYGPNYYRGRGVVARSQWCLCSRLLRSWWMRPF